MFYNLHTSQARSLTSPTSTRKHGTRSNWRQEAEEEVVQGQGYANPHYRSAASRYSATAHHRFLHEQILTCHPPTVKDKAQHTVILDKATNEKLQKDVQSYRLVTVAVLVDRLKINGSLARKALADLEEKGVIRQVVSHSAGKIYSE